LWTYFDPALRSIHKPIAQNRTIITNPSVLGEKKNSVPGFKEINSSKTRGAIKALMTL